MRKGYWIAIALLTILLFTGLFFFNNIYTYLSPVKSLPAEIFVLEGWAHESNLETAVRAFKTHGYRYFIITAFPDSALMTMGWEGKLTFHLHQPLNLAGQPLLHATLSGTWAAGDYARFIVFVNDTAVGGDVTTKTAKTFAYPLPAFMKVRKVDVAFINDAVDKDKDRNLIVHDLSIDHMPCDLKTCYVEYNRKNEAGEDIISPVFGSYALKAKHDLIAYGIADSLIIPIQADTMNKSRTYSTALAVKNYLHRSGIDCPAIMVMSHGVHARRSYISYKKAFGKGTLIGITASEDIEIRKNNWFKSPAGRRKIFREVSGVLYARFFL